MKKLFAMLVLAAVLLVLPAQAAENSMENFVRGEGGPVYDNNFSDLPEGSTFYENVAALYEYGLTVGKGDGTFGPGDNLTVSQVVIFAGRIRSIYCTGDAETGPAAYRTEEPRSACMPYLDYLKAEGVLDDALDEALFTPATRGQVAYVLARVLPEEAVPDINGKIVDQMRGSGLVPDVTEETAYSEEILWLYDRGISHGSDEQGSFFPESPITRGAVAAMLTRLVEPELRILIVWEAPDLSKMTMGSLVEPGKPYAAPANEEELDSAIRFMLMQDRNTMTLNYPGISVAGARKKMLEALELMNRYCEQGYNAANTSFSRTGKIEITFKATAAEGTELQTYRNEALKAAIAVHDQLWEQGSITADMTEKEKAQVYFLWICLNTEYDYNGRGDSVSHLPYGLFKNGLAVCDGYTGAYNLLLKLEGIDCTAYATDTHMWTVATLDGVEYHIDTTWGDAGDSVRPAYFATTPEESMILHDTVLQ